MPHLKPLIAYDASKKCLMTPGRQSSILDARLLNQQGYQGKGLPCPRISASIVNFVRLMDPGYAVDSLEPVKLWVPTALLPKGLVIQGRIQLKKRAKYSVTVGGEKRRKVTSRESSTECLEKPESSSMGSARGRLNRGQVGLNDSEGTSNQLVDRLFEGGDKIKATGFKLVPRYDEPEVIDLTEESEDKPETLKYPLKLVGFRGPMGVRSPTPCVDGDYIDLTI